MQLALVLFAVEGPHPREGVQVLSNGHARCDTPVFVWKVRCSLPGERVARTLSGFSRETRNLTRDRLT
jgi:hypothetical protein